eukprot:scaffold246706_cov23-Prasinocladus_malaysianus.AAC.1
MSLCDSSLKSCNSEMLSMLFGFPSRNQTGFHHRGGAYYSYSYGHYHIIESKKKTGLSQETLPRAASELNYTAFKFDNFLRRLATCNVIANGVAFAMRNKH